MAVLGAMGRVKSHLGGFSVDTVQDRFEGRIGEAGLCTSFLVVLESFAHSFRAIVKGVAKGLVDRLKRVAASHENLFKMMVSQM